MVRLNSELWQPSPPFPFLGGLQSAQWMLPGSVGPIDGTASNFGAPCRPWTAVARIWCWSRLVPCPCRCGKKRAARCPRGAPRAGGCRWRCRGSPSLKAVEKQHGRGRKRNARRALQCFKNTRTVYYYYLYMADSSLSCGDVRLSKLPGVDSGVQLNWGEGRGEERSQAREEDRRATAKANSLLLALALCGTGTHTVGALMYA